MKRYLVIVLSLAVVYVMFSFTAMAQVTTKKTMITINQPMEIPGKPAIVLPPGKYVIKLLDLAGSRNIVQFFNSDETKLYSTVIGIPDYRLTAPPEKTEISFYEPEPGRAHPIRAWFYPGSNYGVEFVYSKERALEVAKATRQHVMSAANPNTANPSQQPTATQVAELKTETVMATTPEGREISLAEAHPEVKIPAGSEAKAETEGTTEVAKAEPLKPASATSATATPTAAPKVAKALPKTASNLPLFGLFGVMLLGAGFSLRVLLR